MRINEIKDGEVNVTLTSGELVDISNMLYEKEKKGPLKPQMYGLAAQVATARDLSQYGHLDAVSLATIFRYRLLSGNIPNKRRLEKIQSIISLLADEDEEKELEEGPANEGL